MKIDIGTASGIDKAIAYLDKYMTEDAIKDKLDAAAIELAEEGMEIAAEAFAGTSASVYVRNDENGYSVVAESPEIAFLEFGAGLTTDGSGEIAKRAPFNVEEGSYSVSQDPPGMYAQTGFQYWEHDGEKMNAVIPRQGMELAREHIVDNAEKKLKEVFSGD